MIVFIAVKEMHTLTIKPGERKIQAEEGANLLDVLQENDLEIESPCGGQGTCGKCWVRIMEGEVEISSAGENFFSQEEKEKGFRLACQTEIKGDLTVYLPGIGKPVDAKSLLNKVIKDIEVNSGISKEFLKIPPPNREDQRPDSTRLLDEMGKELKIPLSVLHKIPSALRKKDFEVTSTFDGEKLLDIDPGRKKGKYGVVFDIGTTTLASYLLNLDNGEEIAVSSEKNPQVRFGADVISRIKHVREKENGLKQLRSAVLDGLNELIERTVNKSGIEKEEIYKVALAGNSTMTHLFSGVEPTNLDQSPYIPGIGGKVDLSGKESELDVNPQANVVVLPPISGYVGSDILAGILYTGIHNSEELCLLIDIGTNGEIVLGNKDQIVASSTAAGPAFEAANIKYGTSAREGAISHLTIEDGKIDLQVIGNTQPDGICGSGLVDAAGELLANDVIEAKGNFSENPPGKLKENLTTIEGERAFLLSDSGRPILLTQKDIRELQLAKGAIRAGIEILLGILEAKFSEVKKVYLAGAFGNYLTKKNALRIGLLPPTGSGQIISAGNSAGQGSKMAILNTQYMDKLEEIKKRTEYIELSFRSDFSHRFMKSMEFPKT